MLSTLGSTASFDKSPAEASRGITLDLGFSTFVTPSPPPLRFTVVDCPGHSSLIRQVLSCRSIVDAVVLVVSATDGVQAQTVECLVIADTVLKGPMPHANGLVVVSKVDSIEGGVGGKRWDEVVGEVRDIIKGTNMEECDIVPCSAREPEKYVEGVRDGIRRSVRVQNVIKERKVGMEKVRGRWSARAKRQHIVVNISKSSLSSMANHPTPRSSLLNSPRISSS